MELILRVFQVFLAIGLIGVVLLQRSEGGGLGIGSSGGMGSFMSVRGTANFLTRLTAILAGLFMAVCLILALLAKPVTAPKSIFDTPAPTAPAAPVVPVAPAAPASEAPPAPAPAAPVTTPAPAPETAPPTAATPAPANPAPPTAATSPAPAAEAPAAAPAGTAHKGKAKKSPQTGAAPASGQ